ncbi:hypothetical protein CU100_12280 [Phyllobacterium endophyticum]|uniref:Uncharacterized protein n=1 Tax=Phyllobacterium endophyticum TaxID=1149773 RepID=A0A2P7AVZ4_9HYPH|nr:hypothetical protein CU100_12280 [Phyllobacterium endophyticum]
MIAVSLINFSDPIPLPRRTIPAKWVTNAANSMQISAFRSCAHVLAAIATSLYIAGRWMAGFQRTIANRIVREAGSDFSGFA